MDPAQQAPSISSYGRTDIMSAPAPVTIAPTPATAASTPAGLNTGAGAAFAALMGTMFGDQNSLAAQIFAGAAASAKVPGQSVEGAPPTEDQTGETDAQAQALAGAFAILPITLVDQAQVATNAAAVETGPSNSGAPAPATAPQAAVDAKLPAAQGDAIATAANANAQASPLAETKTTAVPSPILPPSEEQAQVTAPSAEDQPAAASIQAATTQAPPATAVQAATPKVATPEKTAVADKTAEPVDAASPVAQAKAADLGQTGAADQSGANADPDRKPAEPKLAAHEAERREAPALPQTASATAVQATAAAHASTPVRGAPETVAHLAAQIAKHLEGRSTQFDIQLTPAGLGNVGVRVEISAHGHLTAAMSFDNPGAAAEMRNRAAELTRALEQAGFDISGGISFDVAGDQGRAGHGSAQQDDDSNSAWRGRAFQAALDVAGETAAAAVTGALNLQRRSLAGVDIRI